MYDVASSILQQKLSQVNGVGQVFVWGGALPAVRVEVDPTQLNARGLSLEDVRTTLAAANVNQPKGALTDGAITSALNTTDQMLTASQYGPLVVSYKSGAALRVQDIAQVDDSVEDLRQLRHHRRQAVGHGGPVHASPAPTSSRPWTGCARSRTSWRPPSPRP